MFGWVKKQRLKEQGKIFYQNTAAVNSLRPWCERMMPEMIAELEIIENTASQIHKRCWAEGTQELASQEDMNLLLKQNMVLRRLYDLFREKYGEMAGSLFVENFDNKFVPPHGWKEYLRN